METKDLLILKIKKEIEYLKRINVNGYLNPSIKMHEIVLKIIEKHFDKLDQKLVEEYIEGR